MDLSQGEKNLLKNLFNEQLGTVVTISTSVSCHKLKGLLHKEWELWCDRIYPCAVILSLIVSLSLKWCKVYSQELCSWEIAAAQNGM